MLRSYGYSLKTGILTQLAFLILAGMLLMNVIMLKLMERELIKGKVHTGRILLGALERETANLAGEAMLWDEMNSKGRAKKRFSEMLAEGGFTEILIVDKEGKTVFAMGMEENGDQDALLFCRQTLATQNWSYAFYGSTWGVMWLSHEKLRVSSPLIMHGRAVGAITIGSELLPIYRDLRKTQKLIIVYVVLNTLVLLIFGLFLLSRTLIRPIQRILRTAEQFKEGESFPFLHDTPGNEIWQLARSLNMMLARLEENKKELRDHIRSLEEANAELQKAQEEIVRSEKLASVGRLAAGVAHEIGNPIGIILGYLDLAMREDLTREERKDLVERTQAEIARLSQIIRQLLDFSRPATGRCEETSVHRLVMETLEMLNPQPITDHMRIEASLDAKRDAVWADPDQLKQVFLNIVMNAADAMEEENGSPLEVKPNTLRILSLNEDGAIVLRFADSGPGIPHEDLIRIFDPFYTTKEPGKGTGLGLSVSYRIIEGLGGSIHAESDVGEGSTIVIKVPLHQSS